MFANINIELVNSDRRLKQLTARPVFHRMNIISKDLCAVCTLRTSVKLNKPIYVGFSILDLSKLLMYDFHYSVIKEHYGNFAQLCFTDTDSLFYHVLTDDIYSNMSLEQAELHYDFSDYLTNHALHSIKNNKVLGKMKDKMSGTAVAEFIGLRSKMYSLRTARGIEKKTAK